MSKRINAIFLLAGMLIFSGCHISRNESSGAGTDLVIRMDAPASIFEEAFPMGNGRIGATLYGGTGRERIMLNESTLWSGEPVNPDMNPDARTILPTVREALFNEDYKKADQLVRGMQGKFSESYEPLGDLWIQYELDGEATNYSRELDIRNAVSQVSFESGGTTYRREMFVSGPDQVVVVRLQAHGSGKLNFRLGASSKLEFSTSIANGTLMLQGNAPVHCEPNYRGDIPNPVVYEKGRGTRFCALAAVKETDGTVTGSGNELVVENASEAVIVVGVETSFNGFDRNPSARGKDEFKVAEQRLAAVQAVPWDQLLSAHKKDFNHYFNRVSLDLGTGDISGISTPDRLKKFTEDPSDLDLIALYFQFGRYLMISSSRTPAVPANLQGIWNEHVRPPWSSNYTSNINVEMNYWPVEVTNLSEMHTPLLEFIGNLSETGKVAAKNFYGAGGWCLHHNTDIWAMTNPVGDFGQGSPNWANWDMGGAWISTHLWEHFEFGRDTAYLREVAYPLMKGAARFCLDMLVEDKEQNLVTAPSTSPENLYIADDGTMGATLYGATSDLAMIREILTDVHDASMILDQDARFREEVDSALSTLLPYRTGIKGNLREWYHDWEDAEPTHRHVSHLFGMYPGSSITVDRTPDLARAVKRSLELRTNEGTGWSIAWKIALWARLGEGEMAYDAIKTLLRYYHPDDQVQYHGGGTFPNMLDAHPPFQIDGNFGGTAGIAEMLLQSHDGTIRLLPALPAEWNKGSVTGLRARGGYTVSIWWEENQVKRAEILPDGNGIIQVRMNGEVVELEGRKGQILKIRG